MLEYECLPEITFKMLFEFVKKMNCSFDTNELLEGDNKFSSEPHFSMIHTEREGRICKLITRIQSETPRKIKEFSVSILVDELDEEEEIIDCCCSKCNRREKDICKHGISLLYFLCHETDSKRHPQPITWNWRDQWQKLLEDIMEPAFIVNMMLLSSIAFDYDWYRTSEASRDPEEFLRFIKCRMSRPLCTRLSQLTMEQSESDLWFDLRRGRITASIFHEAAHCTRADGSLVERILGFYPRFDSPAVRRGRRLEAEVLDELCVAYRRVGLVLNPDFPEFGASPDGLTEDCVIEVKCPYSYKSIRRYLTETNELSAKCYAQIQLQMLLTGYKRGIFCVASPEFEHTRAVKVVNVVFDENYCDKMVGKARLFWKNAVFPRLF